MVPGTDRVSYWTMRWFCWASAQQLTKQLPWLHRLNTAKTGCLPCRLRREVFGWTMKRCGLQSVFVWVWFTAFLLSVDVVWWWMPGAFTALYASVHSAPPSVGTTHWTTYQIAWNHGSEVTRLCHPLSHHYSVFLSELSSVDCIFLDCAADFTFVFEVNGCYKTIVNNLEWHTAALRCRQLHKDAHLVHINSDQEHTAVARVLSSAHSKCWRTLSVAYGMWFAILCLSWGIALFRIYFR